MSLSLNQGEIDGIRLLADLFVIRDLQKNVLSRHDVVKPHISELESKLKNSVPKVFLAEMELQKQINEVRETWIKLLSKECTNE